MDAKELADRFSCRIAAAAVERDKQTALAEANAEKRADDVAHCKRAFEAHVLPFLRELKDQMGHQFSFAPQIDIQDHKPVGVSFRVGDGGPVSITTAFGNIIVARLGSSGASKGMGYVYRPDAEPFISNSGDLTRAKIARLIEMVIDNTDR